MSETGARDGSGAPSPARAPGVKITGGVGGEAQALADVRAQALRQAPGAVSAIVETMRNPVRGSAAVIAGGRTILELAGALGAPADLARERRAFLDHLRERLSDADWEALKRALDGSVYALVTGNPEPQALADGEPDGGGA